MDSPKTTDMKTIKMSEEPFREEKPNFNREKKKKEKKKKKRKHVSRRMNEQSGLLS